MKLKKDSSEQKLRGAYYTPLRLANAMVSLFAPENIQTVLEPSCGDGVFLDSLFSVGLMEQISMIQAIEIESEEANKVAERYKETKNVDVICEDFFDFYLTGSIFNTDDWNEIGGLKPSIKLSFWYEWLLRATYKGKKIYTIPKIGYNHTLGRKGSLLEQYKESVSDDEAKWLINLAKKEFYFKDERDATKYIYDANKTSDDEE